MTQNTIFSAIFLEMGRKNMNREKEMFSLDDLFHGANNVATFTYKKPLLSYGGVV